MRFDDSVCLEKTSRADTAGERNAMNTSVRLRIERASPEHEPKVTETRKKTNYPASARQKYKCSESCIV